MEKASTFATAIERDTAQRDTDNNEEELNTNEWQ